VVGHTDCRRNLVRKENLILCAMRMLPSAHLALCNSLAPGDDPGRSVCYNAAMPVTVLFMMLLVVVFVVVA